MNSILGRQNEQDERILELSSEIDHFEGYDHQHGRRVAAIADSLATTFNLASRDRFFLQQAALIHDIGELSMNRQYIRSPNALTAAERFDIERHPVIGEQAAAKLGQPRGVQLIIRWHHEWWNGSGYPDAIEGEQIPLAARILRLADTYAALTSVRPFRAPWEAEAAVNYCIQHAAIEFDPLIVKHFLAIRPNGDTVPVAARRQDYRENVLAL